MPRLRLVSLVAVLAALALAPGALAKGRVTASIDHPTHCDAAAGSRISIAFSLTTFASGGPEPFGAGGVFVKLRRAGGRPALRVAARSDRKGHYVARVTVPRGGILRINAGLNGTTVSDGVEQDADVLFPTLHDPCRATR
jgi:hypothetical protein